jgi:uncharacterized protein (TIGR03437 family)
MRYLKIVLLCLLLIVPVIFSARLLYQAEAQDAQTAAGKKNNGRLAHGGDDDDEVRRRRFPYRGKESDWDETKAIREMITRHQYLRQRRAEEQSRSESSTTANVNSADINDIAVLQNDGSLVVDRKSFDLSGKTVQFTPSGNTYTLSAPSVSFDSSFGTKLNFTVPPAVNPKAGTDPGDDAYLTQDIGFNFSFFGTTYTSLAISSNGNIVFRNSGVSNAVFDAGAVATGESLAEFQKGLPRIAPYWHDLDATAPATTGDKGIYLRKDADRVVITWNQLNDFPNSASDNGIQTFQATLFNDGRILFNYGLMTLTSTALTGITPGNTSLNINAVDFTSPPATAQTGPIAEFFSTTQVVDEASILQAFYATHPGRDVYDFAYIFFDIDVNQALGNAFAFYLGIRNNVTGFGRNTFDNDPGGQQFGSAKIQGLMNMNNINTEYPDSPVTRSFIADSALSIFGQEQGHRWLAFPTYPATDTRLLLGRDNSHWNFFMNIESSLSSPAARRSSSMEGSVWNDNGNGTFATVNLVDGYSRLDHYMMGLRPASDVPDTFVITNTSGTNRTRTSSPRPNSSVNGTRQAVDISSIIQVNGARTPDVNASQKNFRLAFILVSSSLSPAQATIDKMTRYRLAWESYFAQATDYRASIDTSLSDNTASRIIAPVSSASYAATQAPGGIVTIFGTGLTSGATQAATSQPLPTTLAGTEVRINGVPAPLFFVSPGQINFQLPRATRAITGDGALAGETIFSPIVKSNTALIEVFINGQIARAGAVQVAPSVPAVFTLNSSGTGPAAALDGFNFTAAPFAATRQDGQSNIIAVFAAGIGADVTDVDGSASNVTATIDGNPTVVTYAGRTPGFTGLNQVNVTLPPGITSGNHNLVISRDGIPSNTTVIAIR